MSTKPTLNWDSRIGRRVRLRDLHILFTVVQHGSMAKASGHLGMSQSAVSQAIAALEHALQVPLLDRTPRGIELTMYGSALVRRGQAAFDELRSGVKDIETLADPESGEVRIASTASMAAGVLPAVIERFSMHHPKVKLFVTEISSYLMGCAALQERKADVTVTLWPRPVEEVSDELHSEILFYDRICLAASAKSSLVRRRKITLADLLNATLISPPPETPGGRAIIEAFSAAGLPRPQIAVTTFSVHVRNNLTMRGRCVAVLPVSILRFSPTVRSLRELPLSLPMPQSPAVIVTLKNRTLSPPVKHFIECAREVAKSIATLPRPRRA